MEQSILNSVKKVLRAPVDYNVFDSEIIMHINAVFVTLSDFGVGPDGGFMIEDASAKWDDFVSNDRRVNACRTYMGLVVRMYFDPPQTGYAITAMEKQIEELAWRITARQDATNWRDPFAPVEVIV